jgi:hypothetical protein
MCCMATRVLRKQTSRLKQRQRVKRPTNARRVACETLGNDKSSHTRRTLYLILYLILMNVVKRDLIRRRQTRDGHQISMVRQRHLMSDQMTKVTYETLHATPDQSKLAKCIDRSLRNQSSATDFSNAQSPITILLAKFRVSSHSNTNW